MITQYQYQDCFHTFWRDDENEGVVVASVVIPLSRSQQRLLSLNTAGNPMYG